MHGRLAGKSIIVLGATSGIGEAVVYLFAKEGGQVVFAGRREEKGKAIEDAIRKDGGKATFVRTDAGKAEDLENLTAQTVKLNGKIDVLINNAGILKKYDATDFDPVEHFDDIFNTNVKSYFLMAKYVLPHMLRQGKGSIVNTGSVGSIMGTPFHASYSASKGAVKQFTMSLALEYASRGIRVNAVFPGLTISDMVPAGGDFEASMIPIVPMGRAAQGKEMAPAFLFFASDESSYCTGAWIVVDGGMTII
jgi:NAD(P)-dependent dehydrogenase (short-subunit alcohol dehydrogenase family)